MHLGNLCTALLSWLSVKCRSGRWILRIEDLDPQRSKPQWARQIEDDLLWLGLEWDEGGLDDKGNHGPYSQSKRDHIYRSYLKRLADSRLIYPCRCTRADIMATQAPHQTDGRVVYSGRCRPSEYPPFPTVDCLEPFTLRLWVPDRDIEFDDRLAGHQRFNPAHECGDFIIRRKDGAWAYQLAVVIDDALMGVTEVMRGDDLLLSTAQQIYLYELLGFKTPQWAHLPLIRNQQGERLSKRDASIATDYLRLHHTPESLLGLMAKLTGLQPTADSTNLDHLLRIYYDKYFTAETDTSITVS